MTTAPARRRWIDPPRFRMDESSERHASWLELFFDLCFVVAIAALASDLHADPTWDGLLRAAALFAVVWWGWMGYTWYATAFDNDDAVFRIVMILAMLAVLGVAANIGRVGDNSSTPFVLAFVILQALLVGLWTRAYLHNPQSSTFAFRYAAGNVAGALIWLASLLLPAPAPATGSGRSPSSSR